MHGRQDSHPPYSGQDVLLDQNRSRGRVAQQAVRCCFERRASLQAKWKMKRAGAFRALSTLLVSLVPFPALAQEQSALAPPPTPPPPTFAEAGPWSFTGVLNLDGLANPTGGISQGAKVLTKAAVSASYDGSQQGHDGLSGLISVQYVNGTRFSLTNVGDVQGVDNIEATGATRLYEAWLAHNYGDSSKGWKVGFVDLNTDFDTQETGALFLNSSDGIGPELSHSGKNGPSIFPTTALAVTAYFRPNPKFTIRAGIFDGTAGSPDHPGRFAVRLSGDDGALFIAQIERRFDSGLRLETGAWAYTAFFDDLHRLDASGNPVREQRSRGAYATVEGRLLHGADDRGMSGWIRAGLADPIVQSVSGYFGGGLVYTGLIAERASDQAGIAFNHAIVDPGDPLNPTISRKSSETTIEASYRYDAKDWLAIQPDVQFIHHPFGNSAIPDALVVGMRLNFTLTKNLVQRVKDQLPISN
jgi:porin